MPTPLITDASVRVTRGQDTKWRVTVGADVSDWAAIGMTVRTDPKYPRTAYADVQAAKSGEIDVSEWPEAFTATGPTIENAGSGIFYFQVPAADMALPVGLNSCVVDVWRLDDGSRWQVTDPTWVSVVPYAING